MYTCVSLTHTTFPYHVRTYIYIYIYGLSFCYIKSPDNYVPFDVSGEYGDDWKLKKKIYLHVISHNRRVLNRENATT